MAPTACGMVLKSSSPANVPPSHNKPVHRTMLRVAGEAVAADAVDRALAVLAALVAGRALELAAGRAEEQEPAEAAVAMAADDRPERDAAVNPSRIFIVRPIATSLLMIAILLVGMVGFLFLPLSALPEVDYPTIQVQTFLPGASPEVMTTSVTAPLERQFGQMPGLREMSSASS